jgi:ribosomal protein S18 acetylase RimI-like enzyme
LHRLGSSDAQEYRSTFRRIGAPYLWFSRLALSDAQLTDVLSDPDIETYVVRHEGGNDGFLELDFRVDGECELCFIGVSEKLQGKGYGRWLMDQAAARAWSRPIDRFWLHTCNLDHARAMDFYVRAGFVPYKRQIEISDDPRVAGLLPLDAAPHIPII